MSAYIGRRVRVLRRDLDQLIVDAEAASRLHEPHRAWRGRRGGGQPAPRPPRPPRRRTLPWLRPRRLAHPRLRPGRGRAADRLTHRRPARPDRARAAGRPLRCARDRLPRPRRANGARGDLRLPRAPALRLPIRRHGQRPPTRAVVAASTPQRRPRLPSSQGRTAQQRSQTPKSAHRRLRPAWRAHLGVHPLLRPAAARHHRVDRGHGAPPMERQHRRGSTGSGGAHLREAGLRRVEHPPAEAGVRPLVRHALVAESGARATGVQNRSSTYAPSKRR